MCGLNCSPGSTLTAVLDRLGRAAARWRFAILAVWAGLAVVGGVFGAGVYDRTETVDDARGQAARAQERLDELDPGAGWSSQIISGKDYFARDLVDAVPPIMYALRELPGVKEVRDAYTAGGLQGDDGKSSLAVVELDPALEGDAALAVADQVAERLRAIPRARGPRRRQAAGRAHVRRAGHPTTRCAARRSRSSS